MTRKYWIQYKIVRKDLPIEYRELEITRSEPIRGAEDLHEISQIIGKELVAANHVPHGESFGVGIVGWLQFESWIARS